MDHDETRCGHSEDDHAQMRDLLELMTHLGTMVVNPRLMLVVEDTGEVHYASSLPSGEAARLIEQMAARVRRYGGNYVHDHYDRGQASQWN